MHRDLSFYSKTVNERASSCSHGTCFKLLHNNFISLFLQHLHHNFVLIYLVDVTAVISINADHSLGCIDIKVDTSLVLLSDRPEEIWQCCMNTCCLSFFEFRQHENQVDTTNDWNDLNRAVIAGNCPGSLLGQCRVDLCHYGMKFLWAHPSIKLD